jgi:PEP-CTERM motif
MNRSSFGRLLTAAFMLGMVLNFGNSVKAGYTQGFEFTNATDFTNNLLNNPNPNVNWAVQNNSSPADPAFTWNITGSTWQTLNGFPAQAGSQGSYVWANYSSVTTPGVANTISNWFMTPQLSFTTGDTISFWTRTAGSTVGTPNTPSAYPDRLQVYLSTNGASTNVGSGALTTGDFSTLLLDVNPTYALTTLTSTGPDGYPITWTQYQASIPGSSNFTGRIGFRYFIEDTSIRANLIGLDSFSTTANLVPEPASFVLMGLGLVGLGYARSRNRKSA